MPITTVADLFNALIQSRESSGVRNILAEIGDSADVEIGKPFGPLGLQWHPFDDNLSNVSSIGLGTKPGRSLTERVTNAMDAVLEARLPAGVAKLPTSCRQAAKQWFGRPITGPDDGLFRWKYGDGDYDRLINLVLLPSGNEAAPTVDVLDKGIGLRPAEFPDTILSLQRGNKLTKLHLIGAFGQGGAATLSFSDYALVVSRHKQEPKVVGFTLIRVLTLSDLYKEDAYAYLALPRAGREVSIPSIEMSGPIKLYSPNDNVSHLPELASGTLVRHFGYKLPGVSGSLSPSEGNLYHYLHVSLFDPLFPFRVIDLRDAKRARDELVTGNRNRLMRLVQKTEEGAEGRIEIRHHRPMEYVAPHGTTDPSIGIEYWVVFAFRKGPKGKEKEQVLRPASNEVFAQKGHPIIGTLNGQNQGELTARHIRDARLALVSRHIVVHIDASNASPRVRRELFSTNREGFKDGDVLKDLTRVLMRIIEEDEELHKIEKELTERVTKRETEQTNKEVIEQITKLLLDAGLEVSKPGSTQIEGGGDKQHVSEPKRSGYRKADPLPTLPYPQVTKFVITSPKPDMKVRQNDHEVVLVETDADAQFDNENRIAIRSEPAVLETIGKAPLRGGRIRWRLRPLEGTKVGVKGSVVATLTKPDGTQLQDSIPFEVLPAKEAKSKREQGLVPPFTVLPVSPEDVEIWSDLWPDLSEGVTADQQAVVAYKAMKAGAEIKVYYSTVFEPYQSMVERLKQENAALAPLFQTSYEVWVGYHAILQEQARVSLPDGVADADAERILEEDRIRVARMQVKQALQTANLRSQLMKAEAEVE